MVERVEGGGLFLNGGVDGCLILSDISGASSARALAGELNRSGFTVSAPALYARRETLAGAAPSNWRIWLDRAREAYSRLDRAQSSVAVIGIGAGGALSLILAAEYPVSAVVAVSPVLRARGALGDGLFLRGLKQPTGEACRAWDLFSLMRLARRSLFAVVAPVLIVRKETGEIHPAGAHLAFTGISSRQKQLMRFSQARPGLPAAAYPEQAWDAIKNHLRLASAANALVN